MIRVAGPEPVASIRPLRPPAMLLLCVCIASNLTGCLTGRNFMTFRHQDPLAGAPRLTNVSNPRMEEIVSHLNQNSSRIKSWRSNDVRITANKFPLTGKLAVEKGRHVRLMVSSPIGSELDLGSNDERFWVWSRRMDPAFVTCKHENLEVARQDLGIPFEPDWLMQALGVAPLPTHGLKMELSPSQQQARLVQQITTAHGRPLRRAILVDLKQAVVLEHSLYDYDGNRVALAKLSGHHLDKASGAVLPHHVMLDWPQNQMSMSMQFYKVQINPTSIDSNLWEMPTLNGYEVVSLDAGLSGRRIVSRPDSGVEMGPIETSSGIDDQQHPGGRFRGGQFRDGVPADEEPDEESEDFDPQADQAGFSRVSGGDDEFVEPTVGAEDDWTK